MTEVEVEKPFIVAAIPAYNEERGIAKVVLLAQRYVDRVVVCDDGSTDMTAEIAEGLGAEVVRHEENLGYGAAIQSLFRRARDLGATVMVTLDADGQHDPQQIPTLIKPILNEGADIAVGSRFLDEEGSRQDIPFHRRAGIKSITKLTNVALNNEMSDAQHGFRAYSRKALEELRLFENGMGVSVEILLKASGRGLKLAQVPLSCRYQGLEKTSRYNPLRHGGSVIMSIARVIVEEKPLVSLGLPGAVFLAVGLLFGAFLLHVYVTEHHIITNVALASIAFTFIGLFAIFTAITLYAVSRLSQKMLKTK